MLNQGCYSWTCPCGVIGSLTFDLIAKRHDRTHQCKTCGRAVRVQRPIMLEVSPSRLAIPARPEGGPSCS